LAKAFALRAVSGGQHAGETVPRIGARSGHRWTPTPARLLALLREQHMLLFAGAGLTVGLGYPLW